MLYLFFCCIEELLLVDFGHVGVFCQELIVVFERSEILGADLCAQAACVGRQFEGGPLVINGVFVLPRFIAFKL